MDLVQTKTENKITFSGDLSIYNVGEIVEKLNIDFISSKNIYIDLHKVTDFDTAGVQLLIMLKKHANQCEHELKIINLNDTITGYLTQFQLYSFFSIKEAL